MDVEQVGRQRAGRRPPAAALFALEHLDGVPAEVLDDQEVGRETDPAEAVDFELDPLAVLGVAGLRDLLGDLLRPPEPQLGLEVVVDGRSAGAVVDRQAGRLQNRVRLAPVGDGQRGGEFGGGVGLGHFRRGGDVVPRRAEEVHQRLPLRQGELAVGLRQARLELRGQQHPLVGRVLGGRVVRVARRDALDVRLLAEPPHGRRHRDRCRHRGPVGEVDLQVDVVGPERQAVTGDGPEERRLQLRLRPQQRLGPLVGRRGVGGLRVSKADVSELRPGAARERQPVALGERGQFFEREARRPLLVGGRRGPDQALPAGQVLGDDDQAGGRVAAGRVDQEPRPQERLERGGQVGGASDSGQRAAALAAVGVLVRLVAARPAGRLHSDQERRDAGQSAVVGQRARTQAEAADPGGDLPTFGGRQLERVVRGDLEGDVHGGSLLSVVAVEAAGLELPVVAFA